MTKPKRLLSALLTGTVIMAITSTTAFANDLMSDMDSLGNNDEIIERARALDPENRVRIVQNRAVDRYNRLEFALGGGLVTGGETYLETSEYGLDLAYHFTPRWTIGASYSEYRYGLTSEGEKVLGEAEDRANAGYSDYNIPQVVYPKRNGQINISWYPIYGKTNLFDITTAQFDVYIQGGIGQIQMESPYESAVIAKTSTHPIYSLGTGLGLWLTQHISTRVELRHEMFSDEVITGTRDRSWTTIGASLGFLL